MLKTAKSPTKTDIEIGKRIRAQRIIAGMSQSALGDQLGVSFQQVQKYEKGMNRIGGARLVQIAKALETSPSALLDTPEGTNNDTMTIMAFMTTRQGVSLARAFMKIPEWEKRNAIVKVAEQMSAA